MTGTARLRPLALALLVVAPGLIVAPADVHAAPPDFGDAVARMAAADFVLLGELHDVPSHHAHQARFVEGIGKALGAVVFEMVPASLQGELDAAAKAGPASIEGLGDRLRWAELGWPDWNAYAPVFEAALGAGVPLVAGNLDRNTIMALYTGDQTIGTLPGITADGGPLPEPLAAALDEELDRSHCNRLAADQRQAMAMIQRARDAFMASRMLDHRERGTVVLIAGMGHARKDRGVPFHLRKHAPQASILALGFREAGANDADKIENESALFDLIWPAEGGGRSIEEACAG